MIIKTNDGNPFKGELGAKGKLGKLAKAEGLTYEAAKLKYKIVKVDGGYIIEAPDVQTSPAPTEESITEDVQSSESVNDAPGEAPAKKQATTPWKPSRKLDIPAHIKDPRFVYRGVNKNEAGRVRQMENDGYEVDTQMQKKMTGYEKQHGKNLDSTYQVNELIFMRITKEKYAEHRKYYSDLTNGKRSQNEEEVGKNMGAKDGISTGISMYKPAGANM